MVRPVCARITMRTTMQPSSLVRMGTTSKWFATNRPDSSAEGASAGGLRPLEAGARFER